MPHEVLISYSSHDKLQADAVCNRLESQGIRCWIAPRDVPVGSEYADSIVQAIESAQVMVLLYSRNADASEQVKREVERAVSAGIHIMPVRIEDTEMSKSFEYYVGSIHWLDAISPPFEAHIDRLAQDLKSLLEGDRSAGPDVAPPARPAPPVSPAVERTAGGTTPVAPPPPSPPPPQPAKRRTTAIAVVVVVLVAATAFVVYRGGAVTVEKVAGESQTEAIRHLEDQGFEVVTELAESDLPAGEAIDTDPDAGEKARRGSRVTLRVSGMVTMPAVVGLQETEARQRLRQGVTVGDSSLTDDQIEVKLDAGGAVEGEVLSSDPAAGQRMLLGATVTLYVAGAKVAVPDVVAGTAQAARTELEEARLQVEIAQDWEADQAVGTVLRTEPAAGKEVDRGSTVRVFVVGEGGWVYANTPGLEVGQVFRMPRALTRRRAANSDATGLGALAQGKMVRVLAPPTGDGWVKVVVN